MADSTTWIAALRSSHDRFAALVSALDDTAVEGRSYDTDWTIAQVASHLGSQTEIFQRFLDAGLSGATPPGVEQFHPIWDRWNAKSPRTQVADSVTANAALVGRIEALSEEDRETFSVSMFGNDVDLTGFAGMRLGEHAVHTWDIAVALDPTAEVAPDAVELLIDLLPAVARRAGKPAGPARTLGVHTTAPERTFTLTTGPDVALTVADQAADDLTLPAAALLRLVYGRLDPEHAPADLAESTTVAELRQVFPGF